MSRGARRVLGAWASDVGAWALARTPIARVSPASADAALVVELSRLGDAIQAYAVAAHLRSTGRYGSVTLAVDSANAALFAGQAGVDDVLGVHGAGRRRRDLAVVAAAGATTLVNVSPSIRNTIAVFGSAAASQVGYFDWTSPLTPFRDRSNVVLRSAQRSARRVVPPGTSLADRAQPVLALLDLPTRVPPARLAPPPASVARVAVELREIWGTRGGGLAVLHPGANWRFRGWPTDRWIALGHRLIEDLDARVVVLGGRGESALLGAISRALGPRATAWSSQPLPDVAALLDVASAFVGGDSGPLHFASAVGTPSVGLFGPASPALTAPLGFAGIALDAGYSCSPCDQIRCVRPTDPCIHALGVARVAAAASEVWRSVSRG